MIEEILSSEFEVDESCFRGRRKGKRRRGIAGKVPIFGILKRVASYTQVIPDAKKQNVDPTLLLYGHKKRRPIRVGVASCLIGSARQRYP